MNSAVFLLALLTAAQTSLPAAENEFAGKWISNFSKLKLPPNYPIQTRDVTVRHRARHRDHR